MSDRLIEQRWVEVKGQCMNRRLDTLRQMADYRAQRIERSPTGTRRRDEQEHAALMWAIAELSGIGDEVRRERLELHQVKVGSIGKAVRRAELAEALNVQFRVKVDALKAEVHRLSRSVTPQYLSDVADRIIEMDGCCAHDWLVAVARRIKVVLSQRTVEEPVAAVAVGQRRDHTDGQRA